MALDVSEDLTSPNVTAWAVTQDFAMGVVRPHLGSVPAESHLVEWHHSFGFSEMPCEVEVEGEGSAFVGPDIVRFHNVGDHMRVKVQPDLPCVERWVVVSEDYAEAVLSEWGATGLPASRPFGRSFVTPSLPDLAAVRTFFRRAECGADPLWIGETLGLLMGRLLRGERQRGVEQPTSVTPRRYELVREADALLVRDYAEPLGIGEIARALEVTPPHLARCYRAVMGRTMHSRLTSLRLAAAMDRLAAGAPQLTDLALDLGYSNHSHFTTAFRDRVGMAPSQFRALCAA